MSAPADKDALDKLNKIAEANIAAGDWQDDIASLPGEVVPTSAAETIAKLSGDVRLPKKGK